VRPRDAATDHPGVRIVGEVVQVVGRIEIELVSHAHGLAEAEAALGHRSHEELHERAGLRDEPHASHLGRHAGEHRDPPRRVVDAHAVRPDQPRAAAGGVEERGRAGVALGRARLVEPSGEERHSRNACLGALPHDLDRGVDGENEHREVRSLGECRDGRIGTHPHDLGRGRIHHVDVALESGVEKPQEKYRALLPRA
jgi:hypothetical protein